MKKQTIQSQKRDVLAYFGDNRAVRQHPKPLTCSANGMELISDREIEPFKIYQIEMQLPDPEEGVKDIRCSGVVVDCQPESTRFKLQVKFLDLPESARANLAGLTNSPPA